MIRARVREDQMDLSIIAMQNINYAIERGATRAWVSKSGTMFEHGDQYEMKTDAEYPDCDNTIAYIWVKAEDKGRAEEVLEDAENAYNFYILTIGE
jgi:hypothetical protein